MDDQTGIGETTIFKSVTDSGKTVTVTVRPIEAERVVQLHPLQQRDHPSAIPADQEKLVHINTYGALPEFYIDRPFMCRSCGKQEIWRARDQKWYYEEAKGHIDALAVECNGCRQARKQGDANISAT